MIVRLNSTKKKRNSWNRIFYMIGMYWFFLRLGGECCSSLQCNTVNSCLIWNCHVRSFVINSVIIEVFTLCINYTWIEWWWMYGCLQWNDFFFSVLSLIHRMFRWVLLHICTSFIACNIWGSLGMNQQMNKVNVPPGGFFTLKHLS